MICDHSAQYGDKATGSRYFDGAGGRAVIRLDKMRDCTIRNIVNPRVSYRLVKKGDSGEKPEPKTQAQKEAIQVFALKEGELDFKQITPKLLVCEKEAFNSNIEVSRPEDVLFLGKNEANRVAVADDQGITRVYQGSGARPIVQNLPPTTLDKLVHAKVGDLAMIEQKDGEPAVCFFDGKKWQRLAIQPAGE